MNLKDMSDEDYFAALKVMHLTEGWSIFKQELIDQSTSINSVEDTTTIEELYFRKGQLAVIGNVLNQEHSIELAELTPDEAA